MLRRAVLVGILCTGGLACGASAPPLEAHERAVDGERGELAIGGLHCDVPAELFVAVELRFERAQLFLEAAPMGASLESLADDEAETLRLLAGAEVVRRVRFVGDVRAIELHAGDRRTLVAMTSPWRVLRARGTELPHFTSPSRDRIASLQLDATSAFREARFRGRERTVVITPEGASDDEVRCRVR